MHIDLPATRPAIGFCSYNSDGYTHYYVYSNEKIIDGDINIFSTMKVSTYTCFLSLIVKDLRLFSLDITFVWH